MSWVATHCACCGRLACAQVSRPPSLLVPGVTGFVAAGELPLLLAESEALNLLCVELPPPGPGSRGRLAVQVEKAIEASLMRGGACAPGIGASASLAESLLDQLYRARLIERRGIALALPSLEGIADPHGVLDPDDSALLRSLFEATEQLSLRIFSVNENQALKVYGPPQALGEFWNAERPPEPITESRIASARAEWPTVAPEVVASSQTMELSEPQPAVFEQDGALSFSEPLEESAPESTERTRSEAEAVLEQAAEPPAPPVMASEVAPPEVAAPEAAATEPMSATLPSPSPIGDLAQAVVQSLIAHEEPPLRVENKRAEPKAKEPRPARPPAATLTVPPLYPNAETEWRSWLSDLLSARGPKPLSTIERMFVSSYVPLRTAALLGYADANATRALDTWSESFAQSYRDAFDALRVRGKRPTMVLDAPELALRIGRLHGARSVQLLLVDGMRFDLGLRVEQRVRALTGQQAALAERLLLWAALPSTTEAQIELIGRGPDGLREPISPPEAELPVARGRSATTLRRVKAGHRDLLKLDVVEARCSEVGPSEATRLDAIADETAAALADHLLKQAPRTLVFAFGDHGFLFDPLEDGTAAARRGGGTPEEILVPAFAWLAGGVH